MLYCITSIALTILQGTGNGPLVWLPKNQKDQKASDILSWLETDELANFYIGACCSSPLCFAFGGARVVVLLSLNKEQLLLYCFWIMYPLLLT